MEDLPSKEIAALLNRIAQGDDQAVRTLYQHYQRSVYLKTNFPVKTPPFREEPGWGGVFAAPSQPLSER